MIVTVEIVCPFCGAEHGVEVNLAQFERWHAGAVLIQHAMPNLSPTEREQLISGLCPKCQAEFFDSDDEDEDEGDDILACEMESLGGNWW